MQRVHEVLVAVEFFGLGGPYGNTQTLTQRSARDAHPGQAVVRGRVALKAGVDEAKGRKFRNGEVARARQRAVEDR